MDGFSVFLYRGNQELAARNTLKHQNEVTFDWLQPGQMYTVMVRSTSGELQNNNTAAGRTGQTFTLTKGDLALCFCLDMMHFV